MTVNSKMTALADEIRELSGTTTPKSIDAMTSDVNVANTEIMEQADLIVRIKSVVDNLPEAGGTSGAVEWSENEDKMVENTLTAYTNDRVASIGQGAFAFASNLQTVSFPNALSVGSSAFYKCSNLTEVNLPMCTNINSNAFADCDQLITASFPACISIGNYAFYNCQSLTTANFPACTNIASSAFNHCFKLTTVSCPACATISNSAFYNCSKLTTASFPACTNITNYAFGHCFNLKTFYLTNSVVCTLANSNAFKSTPIGGYSASAGTYGSIYVPASLVSAYKSATNWVAYADRITAIVE